MGKSDPDYPLKVFAKGLKKMIGATFKTHEVAKSDLKEVLMAPKQSVKAFVEEKKLIIDQEILMKSLLND